MSKTTIRKFYKPFLAVVGLAVISLAVGAYITSQQRMKLPFISPDPLHLEVAMENAQAVTPGQGQTVQVAGVKIGDITKVTLEDGRAIVGVDIEPEFDDLVHSDATAMLRPRTGLKDMYIQIFPGKEGKPVGDGFRIPVQNTATDVDVDEILSTLDQRTRDYLQLLIDGAGKGLRGNGGRLREVVDRYGPTMRDLATVNRSVSTERVALRRLVTSLSELNTELARKPENLSQLVDASSATFGAFAAEDQNLRATVSELPDTLKRATSTLERIRPFARELGPTSRALIPAVAAIDKANDQVLPFAKEATPTLRDPIRPFVREARPLVADLAPAATALSKAVPEATRSGKVLNNFFNMLAFNPGGREDPNKPDREEGFLFWLAWVTHQGIELQNVEDANGPMRPVFLTGTCGTLTSLVNDMPALEFGLNLTPILASVCDNPPTQSIDLSKVTDLLKGALPKGKEAKK